MTPTAQERRQHERHALGLPVRVRLPGRGASMLAELLDISESGARFGGAVGEVLLSDDVVFGFVLPDRPGCQAMGQVVRVEGSGQFVVALNDVNDSFVGFIRLLCAES
jgi:hypothetical protein